MHVVATAGHVDHGKSTLVRALTGQDPDRLDEEHRRGQSIELGFCWTSLPTVGDVAFVDVPGHERFVSTMLAGVGPVPAVLFVVAADDPWMPQAAEHLAALDAFDVRHGVVAITRSDLADPAPAVARTRERLLGTSLEGSPLIPVSARDGSGLEALRTAIVTMTSLLPAPPDDAAVRLWVDRRFQISGAGVVVTGTLPAGRIQVGDELAHRDDEDLVRVRGIELLGESSTMARGVARVALRLGGGAPAGLTRGGALVEPGGWQWTDLVDVRIRGHRNPPERPLLHVGSASLGVRCRPLGADLYRLSLEHSLPLHVGDRMVLRDPGSRALWGSRVLDPAPPGLRRRGAARRRTAELAPTAGTPDLADELRRRGFVSLTQLRRLGVLPPDPAAAAEAGAAVRAGEWLLGSGAVPALQRELSRMVEARSQSQPLDHGVPLTQAAHALGLPTPELVSAVVPEPLSVVDGRIVDVRRELPRLLTEALQELEVRLAAEPFAAPDATTMAELGLDPKAVAAASRAGRLLRVTESVVLLPGADLVAAERLRALPQPFTASQARVQLGTSRRVALPLLELLDQRRLTRRFPDDRREVIEPSAGGSPAGGSTTTGSTTSGSAASGSAASG